MSEQTLQGSMEQARVTHKAGSFQQTPAQEAVGTKNSACTAGLASDLHGWNADGEVEGHG